MRYEPVGYILEYEISALVFLLVIILRYFGTRRFPNQKNRLFAGILWATVADMVLDLLSSVIIDNVFLVPLPLVFLVNTAFYCFSIIMPLLMMTYTLALIRYLDRSRMRRAFPLYLPGLAALLMLLTNPLTRWFFYVDPVSGYVHGRYFICIYVACFFYLLVTFLLAFGNRAKLRPDERRTVFMFLAVVLASTLVQYIYPVLLVTGVAIALSVILMYFTIQNPETMLDTSTGAFTYEAMLTFLRDRMQERERVQLIAVKIHNMPRINETLGIENGSLLLRQICQFLRDGADDSWVFRMRGSCFVAITRKSRNYHALCAMLDRRIEQSWTVGSVDILLQATVCRLETEELPAGPVSPEETVNYLESALLQGGRSSRIKTITVGAKLLDRIKRSRSVEAALREALESGEGLELYFQPLWSVKQGRFTNAEVLLRFRHPVMGSISPAEFVPIAESNGLVTAMDELVMRKTCAFIRDNDLCRQLGLEALEVNLSALEFMYRRLPELLSDILAQYRVDPGFLFFEITETAATESFDLLQECMLELTHLGCRFALDDFGTGYANISQVIQLPFSMVKLDKSLLYGPEVVLEDMARMFTRMERRTVIEGVESAEQAERMCALPVDYIQGYHYAKPMNQEDFLRFLRERASKPPD